MTDLPSCGIDAECVELCKALNLLPGISTIESCCGHGNTPFHIWFLADGLDALRAPAYWLDSCHCGRRGWQIIVATDCGASSVSFLVEGPVGAYEDAEYIANLIVEATP